MAARTTKKSGAALERLRADLKAGSPANVYIFFGEETYLRDRYLERSCGSCWCRRALRSSTITGFPERD